MKSKSLFAPILVAALTLLTACGDPEPIHMTGGPTKPVRPPVFEVTSVELKAEPSQGAAPCPVTVRFSGLIQATGSGEVQYTFARSDGTTSPVHTMNFSGSNRQSVSDVWTLGDDAHLSSYAGWQTLKVLSPNVLETSSEAGAFSINCER
jgi:hypothetical protein